MSEEEAGVWKLGEVSKEQIKLTATYFNGIAVGLVIVGGLSLPTTIALNAADARGIAAALALCLFSFGMSAYLHARGRRFLKGLE